MRAPPRAPARRSSPPAGSSSRRCSCSALADFNATREMGPILALGIVVMIACGLTLLPALLAVFGRRAFWPAIPRVEPSRPAARAGRGSARSSGAGRVLLAASASRCSPRARSATSAAAATSTSPSSTATRRSPCQGQQLIAERYDPPGRVAPVDVVVRLRRRARGQGRAGQRAGRRARPTPTPQRRRRLISLEVLLEVDPFSTQAMDLIPTPARGRAPGRRRRAWRWSAAITAENHDNREALRARRAADRAARAGADPARADRAAALRRRAAVRDRDRRAVVRVRARRVVADLHARLRPARLRPEPDDLRVHLPRRARASTTTSS